MREIKFRIWNKIDETLQQGNWLRFLQNEKTLQLAPYEIDDIDPADCILMQYTGLKDKNEPCKEVYEGDIIDVHGKIKGNIYEIKEADKDQFDLVIQGFGTKAWLTTYQNAVDRGCKDSE